MGLVLVPEFYFFCPVLVRNTRSLAAILRLYTHFLLVRKSRFLLSNFPLPQIALYLPILSLVQRSIYHPKMFDVFPKQYHMYT